MPTQRGLPLGRLDRLVAVREAIDSADRQLRHSRCGYCTSNVADPVIPPEFAPIVVVPTTLVVANPATLGLFAMVATVADEELQ